MPQVGIEDPGCISAVWSNRPRPCHCCHSYCCHCHSDHRQACPYCGTYVTSGTWHVCNGPIYTDATGTATYPSTAHQAVN